MQLFFSYYSDYRDLNISLFYIFLKNTLLFIFIFRPKPKSKSYLFMRNNLIQWYNWSVNILLRDQKWIRSIVKYSDFHLQKLYLVRYILNIKQIKVLECRYTHTIQMCIIIRVF